LKIFNLVGTDEEARVKPISKRGGYREVVNNKAIVRDRDGEGEGNPESIAILFSVPFRVIEDVM
jgi:hypothetical protein